MGKLRVGVTGGTGFVGRYLLQCLRREIIQLMHYREKKKNISVLNSSGTKEI